MPPMNRRKFERIGKGVSKNGQTEAAPYKMIHPQRKPLQPMVIGRTFLRNQYWMLDFERTFSLSRFGKQTADNFVHRATRSKMTVFKTTFLIQGDGQGRFFGCAGSAHF